MPLLLLLLASPVALVGDRSGVCPGWLTADECSPFYPDDAFLIRPAESAKEAWFRTTFELPARPVRAVLALTAIHTAAAHLNGALALEVHCPEVDRLPGFGEVTAALRPGVNSLDLRVRSIWSVAVYAQLRVELPGGEFLDVITGEDWQEHAAPTEGWPRGEPPADGWRPVRVVDDYVGSRGQATRWDKRFALMPRALLREWTAPRIAALERSWPEDRRRRAEFHGRYTRPEVAERYRHHLRIEPASGQVVDGGGAVRHLFFTIYGQAHPGGTRLGWLEFDYDRLEEDLALMEQAEVHPYLRFLGWDTLLDESGEWRRCERQPAGAGLPRFELNVEVLDWFLDRCQAHGRYVVLEGDFFWNASWDAVPGPYHTRWYLYPEMAELNALAHRKILARYADRPVVAGYMIGEEDIIMAADLDNGHLRTALAADLQSRYGDLAGLQASWAAGYDFTDPSRCRPVSRTAEQWGVSETVLEPAYPLRAGVWSAFQSFADLALPIWPRYRTVAAPHLELPSHRSLNTFTPDDPVWIDYNTFREDRLYLEFVNRWAKTVRAAAPRQWLFHSNAQDFTAQWHFLHFYRRAELEFDVIGVGCHDDDRNLADLAPCDRMRKYYKNIAAYRPYVAAPGSPAVAVSCGEGQGGRPGDEQEILNYYRAQSFELVGHGGAFEQSYTWLHLAGAEADPAGRGRMTKALAWMGDFYRQTAGVRFSLPRRVEVLVVRNNHLARSNRSGRDYGNAAALADFLGQLNLEFDIVMDEDLAYGPSERKVDLTPYRLVLLPCADIDYSPPAWAALDQWLSDPAGAGRRTLVIGGIGKRSAYLAPTPTFPATAAQWLGQDDYVSAERLTGPREWYWTPLSNGVAPRTIRLNDGDRGDVSDTGFFGRGRPLLTLPDGRVGAVAVKYQGNRICAFGFPLGKNWDLTWGLPAPQDPYDALTGVLEDIVTATGLKRPIRAPHNLRVAVSDDRSVILVQERFGIDTTDLVTLDLPPGARYEDCESIVMPDGKTLLRRRLPAWEGVCLKRVAPPRS